MKLEDPVKDEEVRLALRRALRRNFSRPKQARGLTSKLRDVLIQACSKDCLTSQRDKALISVGYDTLARRSELVSIVFEDIVFTDAGSKILIKRSKNDQHGYGRVAHISKRSTKLLKDWIRISGISEGYVFRSVMNDVVGRKALHPHSIGRIIKRVAEKAGLSADEVRSLSSHSMRIGAAQDMMIAGFDILPIMAAGGWKTTNVVARYIENAELSPILQDFLNGSL
jgi:integrase/recombinase XerD